MSRKYAAMIKPGKVNLRGKMTEAQALRIFAAALGVTTHLDLVLRDETIVLPEKLLGDMIELAQSLRDADIQLVHRETVK